MEELKKELFGESGETKELTFEEAKEACYNFHVTSMRIISSTGLEAKGARITSRGNLYNKWVTPGVIAEATGEERVRVVLARGKKMISSGKLKNLKFVLIY